MISPESVLLTLLHCDWIPVFVGVGIARSRILVQVHDRRKGAHDGEALELGRFQSRRQDILRAVDSWLDEFFEWVIGGCELQRSVARFLGIVKRTPTYGEAT